MTARWQMVLLVLVGLLPVSVAALELFTSPPARLGSSVSMGFVTQGCLPSVPVASLTLEAFACEGAIRTGNALVRVGQSAAAVGPLNDGDGTYWLALTQTRTAVVAGWTRQSGTYYLWQAAATRPAAASGVLLVARVTVAENVITAVADYRLPASYARAGVFDVTDPLYGAVDDDVTNNRAAITSALAAAAVYGSTVYFPVTRTGVYYVSGQGGSTTVAVPVTTATYGPSDEVMAYQFYAENVSGLRFRGDGVTIRSDFALGGTIFLFNGLRDFVWDGIALQSVHAYDVNGTNTVTGMNCLAFTSTAQDSERVVIQNYRADACFAALYVFGSPASAFRVRGMQLSNVFILNNTYGLAFHDNGSNVHFRGVRTIGGKRSYFIYGVHDHDGTIEVDAGTPNVTGFNAIMLKSYDAVTENITLKVHYRRVSTSDKVQFQSQHNLAAQPAPGQVRNVYLDYNEEGFAGGGGVAFSYYQDDELQTTSNLRVFDNIHLRGVFENDITTQTVFTGAGRVKVNLDDVVFIAGSPSLLQGNQGFYTTAYHVYTPELLIGGLGTGITYATQAGEFYEVGNMVFGNLRLILSSKGALSGAVTVTLPRTLGEYSARNVVVQIIAYDNWAGLTGAVQGFVNTSSNELTLLQSAATGRATIDHTHLTNTTDLLVTFTYPK